MRMIWIMAATSVLATSALAQSGTAPPLKMLPPPITMSKSPPPKKTDGMAKSIPSEAQVFEYTLKQPLAAKSYEWTVGKPPIIMDPLSTHICLITGVGGNFAGAGERVVLGVDPGAAGGARWTLSASSGQAELRVTATCAAKAKFVPAVIGDGKFFGTNNLQGQRLPHHMNGGCADHIASDGTAVPQNAHFISEMAGRWRGAGERLAVTRKGNMGAIQVNGCSGFVDGSLVALRTSGTAAAKYQTRTARTSSEGLATFALLKENEKAGWSLPFLPVGEPFQIANPNSDLVPYNSALCGFVYLSGKFQGFGEGVDIVAAPNGYWRLTVSNAANGGYVSAAVRCFARDQR